MLRTRIFLALACAGVVWLIFLLPKSVVENETELSPAKVESQGEDPHAAVEPALQNQINSLRARLSEGISQGNSAIFADSLRGLYQKAGRYDSAAWYAEQVVSFFETPESIATAGEAWFQAFSFAMETTKRKDFALKSREYFNKTLASDPHNLGIKTKLALTFFGTGEPPMQGVTLLREVLNEDPKFKPALFNMGMLAVQSQQYAKAIDWLNQLLVLDSKDVQGLLLLGVAYAGNGEKEKAREQFEKAKTLEADPAVQQQADAYLKDLQ